ncbi:GNAT family N-acetyltransferase [Pseudoalteromonas luteoviolacea]|uniref:GNAT family N-acetyltransferase n=1 Tax=Pseudoalteromonas luteoviolacea TaxID=43657 RepID=UPI00068C6A9B|nr:GNAT family N-acetyltransferase [Pseudoalteromonas luteoviolacea]
MCQSIGWAERPPEQLQQAFNTSPFKYFAYKEGKLIGVVITVDDGQFYAWIVDFAVNPKYQGLEAGKSSAQSIFSQDQKSN